MRIISMLFGAFVGLILMFGVIAVWWFITVKWFDWSDAVFLTGIICTAIVLVVGPWVLCLL